MNLSSTLLLYYQDSSYKRILKIGQNSLTGEIRGEIAHQNIPK